MVPQQGGSYCSSILQKYSVYSRLAVITKRGFTLKDQHENKKPGLFANRGDEKEMNSKMEKKMPKAPRFKQSHHLTSVSEIYQRLACTVTQKTYDLPIRAIPRSMLPSLRKSIFSTFPKQSPTCHHSALAYHISLPHAHYTRTGASKSATIKVKIYSSHRLYLPLTIS